MSPMLLISNLSRFRPSRFRPTDPKQQIGIVPAGGRWPFCAKWTWPSSGGRII
jgi:hypothetical protein